MDIVNKGNTTVYKWNIAIAKNNSVSGLIENKSNGVNLEKFRDTVVEIKQNRFEFLLSIIYLIFILIIFASVQKDSQILKNESNKKIFQIFITLLVIFLIYKITISFFELNLLYKDINFYYTLILY